MTTNNLLAANDNYRELQGSCLLRLPSRVCNCLKICLQLVVEVKMEQIILVVKIVHQQFERIDCVSVASVTKFFKVFLGSENFVLVSCTFKAYRRGQHLLNFLALCVHCTCFHDETQVGLNWKYSISELIRLRFTT